MDSADGPALSCEQEAALLTGIPPARLLDLLRSWDGLAARVFAGFRISAANLRRAPVRARLQHEMTTDPKLEQSIRELWSQANAPLRSAVEKEDADSLRASLPDLVRQWGPERVTLAILSDARESVRDLASRVADVPAVAAGPAPPAKEQPADGAAARLREQVAELRREVAGGQRETGRLSAQREEALRQAEKWRAAAAESARREAEASREAERARRQLERLQKAKADLEARLQESERGRRRLERDLERTRRLEEARDRERAERRAAQPPGEVWVQAARELIGQGQAQSAVHLVAHLARRHPRSAALRAVLAEGYEALGALPAAVTEWCWLARWRLKRGEVDEALTLACRALEAAAADGDARRCLRDVAAALSPDPAEARQLLAERLARVPGECPAARRAAAEILGRPTGRGGAHGPPGLDDPVEWPLESGSFSAPLRAVIAAVDANDSDLVERVRRSLEALRRRAPEVRAALLRTLRAYDESYRTVLARRTRPVVVDGSNVAWHGQDRPRLDYLAAMRRELRGLGYFPVYVYVDAALPHQIDQGAQLAQWLARREAILADAGTDADERILGEARALGCPVVTNDRMVEHDPEGEVEKLRFEVDADGALVREWHRGV